jgi:hypothetical protein
LISRGLSAEHLAAAVARAVGGTLDGVCTPLVTFALFVSQVLSDDHSCRGAVARLAAWWADGGMPECSPDIGADWKARSRFPDGLLPRLARDTADSLQGAAPADSLWGGRRVLIADGTCVSMPDTLGNHAAYPQHGGQGPACGFPIARLVVLLFVATGAVIDAVVGPRKGKLSGEDSLMRRLHGRLRSGDVVFADRYYSSFHEVALPLALGVDVVMRQHCWRPTDFRRGRRLGSEDHLVVWRRQSRPAGMTREELAEPPRKLVMREVRARVGQRGFRTRSLLVITRLLDPTAFAAAELSAAYHWRWDAKLDIRRIRQTMRMEVLRCKNPGSGLEEV